jgi:hypothetical protein
MLVACSLGWLVNDLLLRDFKPYVITFITVRYNRLLGHGDDLEFRDFRLCGIML